ncbi:MAG: site-specific integrase [Deltaproteobacteria bacterium]|nr:site-specific integrase [Deltaproteobacteria bacterium]
MALTDLQVRKITPKSERFELLDANGLYIRVMPTGAKTWMFRYNFHGAPRRLTLGRYPAVTLAEAREKHAHATQDIQKGIDPGAVAKEEKSKLKAVPTIEEALKEFWERELSKKKSGIETRRILEKDVAAAWGKRRVTEIKRRHIVLLLDEIEQRAPIMRNRVHGSLTRFFNFSAERGIIDDSPCTRIRKVSEKGRNRVLDDNEIKLLWKALDLGNKAVDLYAVSKLALKMILLTGQRPGEVCGMAWNEINGDNWDIPAERMKGGEPHRVPLTGMAKETIEQARPFSNNSKYVFTSPRSPLYGFKKPLKAKPKDDDSSMTSHALSRAMVRHWKDMGFETDERFTPHDLRRTVRTRLAEIGITDIVAERVLGHKLQGVLGIYNRHSYDVEKRHALSLWEKRLSLILGLSEPISNVIPLEVHHG